MSNSRQILSEIHKNNHTHVNTVMHKNINDYTLLNYDSSLDKNMYTNLNRGMYLINIKDGDYYSITINDDISGDDVFIIENLYNSYAIINGKRKFIRMYEYMREYAMEMDIESELYFIGTSTLYSMENPEMNYFYLEEGIDNLHDVDEIYTMEFSDLPLIDILGEDIVTMDSIPLEDYLYDDLEDEETNTDSRIYAYNAYYDPYDNVIKVYDNYIYDEASNMIVYTNNMPEPKDVPYVLENTVNDYIEKIILQGRTKVISRNNIQSIDYPGTLKSVNKISIKTKNILYDEEITHESDFSNLPIKEHHEIEDELIIPLKYTLKGLPCGITDTFVLDSIKQEAFIISRIDRHIFTGNEPWEFIEETSNEEYLLFRFPYKYIKIIGDNDSINCTHLVTCTFTTINRSELYREYIAVGNTEETNGIYIRLKKSRLPEYKDEEELIFNLKKFLNDIYLSGEPMMADFLTKNQKRMDLTVEEYHIKTFFPGTVLHINTKTRIGIFAKVTEKGDKVNDLETRINMNL